MTMAMDGENVRLTKRLFERWNSGEHAIDPDLVDRDVELQSPLSSSRTVPYHGYNGIRERVAEVEGQFEVWRLEVHEVRELDEERVLVTGVIHTRGHGSDMEVDQPIEWLLTFRDGRLLRYEAFTDEEANPAGVE
jgi:ketosteroid isomerase-like protein